MNYIASQKRSMQIAPDEWDVWLDTMVCQETTTIGEIVERFRGFHGLHIRVDQEAKETT